ncbi:50S ribosomal protein L13 [Bdellovibrionota bacterium FG-1]
MYETTGPHAPKWYVVDAQDQVVGRLATIIARVLIGKHKTTFTRHADTGDFVVVLNADKVVFTRNKWETKLYRKHTGFVSGLKTRTARQMLQQDPQEILREAVWGMTNKTSLANHQMKKLKLYTSAEHPHQAQNPQPLPLVATRHTVLTQSKKKPA